MNSACLICYTEKYSPFRILKRDIFTHTLPAFSKHHMMIQLHLLHPQNGYSPHLNLTDYHVQNKLKQLRVQKEQRKLLHSPQILQKGIKKTCSPIS